MMLDDRIAAAVQALRAATAAHAPAVFTTSLGLEDMVVLDLIHRHGVPAEVVTLDTGRLHEETYRLFDTVRRTVPIRALYPDAQALERFVAAEGVNAFHRGIALRKQCCAIRKLEPLQRALAGKGLWITGLRRAQSVTRADLPLLERDAVHGLMKLNPLLEWSTADVRDYVARFDVPVNALHAQGYPSIGCAPCTRAVAPGEDERAGRWWWEQPDTRECGLHMAPDGRLVRASGPGTTQRSVGSP